MTRILVLIFGVAIATAAFWMLRSDASRSDGESQEMHGEFDSASRAKLERVLRDADQ